MQRYKIDGITFDFPDNWNVGKYDDWSFYRNQFSRMWNGIKAVDLIAVDPAANSLWLIEVKDYRVNQRTKPSDLGEEVALKVFDTLAGMLPAKVHANDVAEQNMAIHALSCKYLRVVLHLEQPRKHSKLFPRSIDPANLQQKIRQLVKPIDAHPRVVEIASMDRLSWTTT